MPTRSSLPRLLVLSALALGGAGGARAADPSGAKRLLWAGDLGAAVDALDRWVAEHPADLEAHELRIDLLLQTAPARAASLYLQQSPLPPTSAAAVCLAARATPDPREALKAYRRGAQIDGQAARCHQGIGSVLRAMGDREGAVAAWRRAVGLDPGLAEAWHGIAVALLEGGDPVGARAAALRLRDAAPDEAEAWLMLASLEPAQGVALLEQGRAAAPWDPRVAVALARTHFQDGRAAAADASYDAALALDPTDAHVRAERAIAAEVADGRLDPAGAATLLGLREALRADRAAALRSLDALVQAAPRSGQARQVRGSTFSGLGRAAEAEADLRVARELQPGSPEAAAALGLHLLSQRRAAEALPLLDAAVAQRPWDVSLAVAAGVAVREARGAAAGQARLEQVAWTFPGDKGPILALAQLHLGAGRPDAAWALLAAAVQRNPDPDLLLALAAASRQAGRDVEAARVLDALAQQTGDARYADAARTIRAAAVPR